MKTFVCVMWMIATAVVGTGCGALPKEEIGRASRAVGDVRGTTPVYAKRARSLVSGPALVEHLETEGSGAVALYLADDPGIDDRACPSASAEGVAPIAVLDGESRLTDVAVPAGKRICVALAHAQSTTVTWHARAIENASPTSFNLALSAR